MLQKTFLYSSISFSENLCLNSLKFFLISSNSLLIIIFSSGFGSGFGVGFRFGLLSAFIKSYLDLFS